MNYSENQKTVESQYSIKAIIKWLCFFKAISIFSNLLLFTINNCYVSCLMYHQNHNLSKRIIFLVQNVLFSTPLSHPTTRPLKNVFSPFLFCCEFELSQKPSWIWSIYKQRYEKILDDLYNLEYQSIFLSIPSLSIYPLLWVYLSIHT